MLYSIKDKVKVTELMNVIEIVNLLKPSSILVISSPPISLFSQLTNLTVRLKEICEVNTFFNIKPDAPVGPLDQLCDLIKKPDLIIAVGGGSVIDSAKALSLAWQGATINDLFYKRKPVPERKITTIVAPTTAGTGAELSYGAILYDEDQKIKSGIRSRQLQPDFIIIDIDLYSRAPAKLIAEAGFDCLTHAIETYLSSESDPLVRYQSVAAIQVVFNHLEKAFHGNLASLEKMAISASMMGINLALSTTCLPHRIQYVIGPFTNTSHAQGLIMLYKGWLPLISATDEFCSLERDLAFEKNDLTNKIVHLKKRLDINYTLGEYNLTGADVDYLTESVTGNLRNDPSYRSIETIRNIIKNSL